MYTARTLTRDALLIATVICSLFILFTLQVLLSERVITGNAIQVGKPDSVNVVIVEPPKTQPPPQPPDPKTQCWLSRGFKQEDIALLGPLLRQTDCTVTAPRQRVQATVNNNCLDVRIGDDATTTLCLEQEQPTFSVELPTPETQTVVIPDIKHNYWLAFLIFLFGISILFIWGRTDLRYDFYRKRSTEDYSRLLPGRKEVQIRYIRPPPMYLRKQEEQEELQEEKPAIKVPAQAQPLPPKPAKISERGKRQSVHVAQQYAQEPALSSALNKSLIKFNALSQSLCDLIALKKFTEAEQQYPELYTLALDIYSKVTEDNKPRLLHVVTSLYEQLQDVRKAYAVAQDVKEVYQREEQQEAQIPAQVWKPATLIMKKEQIRHLDHELSRLRGLLDGEHKPSALQKLKKKVLH